MPSLVYKALFVIEINVTLEIKLRVYRQNSFWRFWVALKKAVGVVRQCETVYLELVYLVTALVPSETACLANSPGRIRRTAVWISLLVMVERLL